MGTLVGGGRTSPPAPTPDCAQEIAGTEAPTAPRERYWPELDGLRAIAVLLVIGYHVDGNVLPGGLFGVDVFFTLSGFLITTVLLEEYARRGRFDLRRFYFRRVLRLYPAMLFMLLGAVALGALIGGPYGWHLTITDVPLAMTYTLNWVAGAAHGLSLVTHLWSLCVEEQFYLIWPLVMLVALRRGPRTALAVACTIAVVAAALTPVLYQLGGTDRVYHGTDARAPELLVGAIAALLIFIRPPAPSVRRLLTVGAVGAVGVVVVAVRGSIPNEFFNSGGYGVFAIAVAALVVHLVDAPARVFTLVLASKPAVMTGRLSYAMYLWHLPLLLTINYYRPSMNHALKFALVLSLTMAISFLSYRVVELPFLRLKNRLPARA